jgi:uncharacterized protein
MPTNLPPDYYEIEKRFREADTPAEKAILLEEMISAVPKHKGTDKLRADLRRQLSKLKAEAQSRRKTGGHQSVYVIEKEGAGQAVLVGFSNTGKSALLDALTNAEPEVSEAPFTTWKPLPGMAPIANTQVQLVDTPPIDRDFIEPGLFHLIRSADLLLLVGDLQQDLIQQVENTLAILAEYRIAPSQLSHLHAGRERMRFLPAIVVANKCDDETMLELVDICRELWDCTLPLVPVSALTHHNFDALKQAIYELLNIIRVYAKPPGQEADLSKPFVLQKDSTVIELARKIHKDFYHNLKSARVWGSSAFDGQMVQKDYVLQDGDIVEFKI